jgi:SsrA-binding protein
MAGPANKGAGGAGDARKVVAENRKARHDYQILDTLEAGLALQGTEVKSLRDGGGNIREAYVMVRDGEAWVTGMHIAPYAMGNIHNHEPTRDRRLLLRKKQIVELEEHITRKGNTIIPLTVYFTRGRAKLAVGIARGRQKGDRRQEIAERDTKRQIERELKLRMR